jgi:hypothetical protein
MLQTNLKDRAALATASAAQAKGEGDTSAKGGEDVTASATTTATNGLTVIDMHLTDLKANPAAEVSRVYAALGGEAVPADHAATLVEYVAS